MRELTESCLSRARNPFDPDLSFFGDRSLQIPREPWLVPKNLYC